MALETWEHDGDRYCLQSTYVKGDEAWYFELSEARPAVWTASPRHDGFLAGPAVVTVIAHAPAVEKPPYVHFDGWSGPRLICIAGDFTRYDVHAVRAPEVD